MKAAAWGDAFRGVAGPGGGVWHAARRSWRGSTVPSFDAGRGSTVPRSNRGMTRGGSPAMTLGGCLAIMGRCRGANDGRQLAKYMQ